MTAQVVLAPVQWNSTGNSPPAQTTTGQPGDDGGAGLPFGYELFPFFSITTTTEAAAILLTSTGGEGADGGESNADLNSNGPLGGTGGAGGALTMTVSPANNDGSGASLQGTTNASGIMMTSQGGSGGNGLQNGGTGNGGIGGTAGAGGALAVTVTLNPNQPNALTLIRGAGTGAGINLYTAGGNGGDSGESSGGDGHSVTGRKGGAGAVGGKIDVTVAGNITSYPGGSGIVAVSVGGDGGMGGAASDYTATATGSAGGNAADGGVVTINVVGGAVRAQGPDTASTGAVESFDSSTDPADTVPLDTSLSAGAIIAISQGGIGGLAGFVDGSATKGGNGAGGGNGGIVKVNIGGSSIPLLGNAVISTTGYNAFGVMALSAGGSGGSGSSGSGAFFRSGGPGGTGGQGDLASITVGNDTASPYAVLSTTGDDSDVLVAISVGGGGGYSGDVNDTSTGGGAGFSLYIGGVGGNGGIAGTALVRNGYFDAPPTDGSQAAFHPGDVITTSGTMSRGIIAQSVGGGGGRGGDATSTSLGSGITIGGKGGTGGTGSLAQAVNFGIISTTGSHSTGIFSQSVGGGGGSGGGALSRVIGAQVSVSIAVGGNGGAGGNAGEADAYNIGQVQTTGTNAHAIFVQSVGGGGGVGGTAATDNYSTSLPDTPSITLTTAVGGKGGTAGDGNIVNVMNAGLLQTQGADAYGIFAQSVGGGGGLGGDASATSLAYQQAKLTISTAIGGSGGKGGVGGSVSVWNSGLVSTSASTAIGIFAQSVGGGGGAGGFANVNQGAIYQGGSFSTELTVAIGGQGGVAADGGDVLVNNFNSSTVGAPGYFSPNLTLFGNRDLTGNGGILTVGDMAAGIFAQSVGGGGGHGGDSTGKGGNGQLSLNVALGGGGGAGGNGGTVTVHNGAGSIQTYGAQSFGIFGQSVGGGGGTGGNAVTGSGEDPEYGFPKQASNLAAGNITQNPTQFTQVTDQIWDWKDNVKGAWDDKTRLQELYDLNNNIDTKGSSIFSGLKASDLTIDVGGGAGGKGGSAGDGGNVVLDNQGSIITHGAMAYAIFAQSVGGGGGVGGGSAPSTANDHLHDSLIASAISLGGSGGKGGDGGSAIIGTNTGADIETFGDLGFGLFAQSVGGGGGVAGASMPNAGLGNPMALSLGGLGNNGGVSGSGGVANAYNFASIQTHGDHGIGMFVQSVGGGGGFVAVTGQTQNTATGLFDSTTQTLAPGTVVPVLAANPLSEHTKGDTVLAQLTSLVPGVSSNITTEGVNAFGILAQSIGGGGGLMVIDNDNQVTVNDLAPEPGESPHGGNDAAIVAVITSGPTRIQTSGNGAVGIVAQSLGGSGALVNGFDGVDVTQKSQQVLQDRWSMGMGGAVTITSYSDIVTTGDYAHGIFAQVASGTGGVIGRSDGTGVIFNSGVGEELFCNGTSVMVAGGNCGGAIAVALDAGTITVSGAHSWGVVAVTENVSWMNDAVGPNIDYSVVEIDIAGAARIIATGNAAGAVLMNGSGIAIPGGFITGNLLRNSGYIDATGSAGGYAVSTVNRSFTVENAGYIAGNFGAKCSGTCSGTVSSIDNKGVIEAGAVVDLGGGEFANSGTLSVRGAKVGTTTLTGNYTGAGTLLLDADYAGGKADRLVIEGTANVSGTVTVRSSTIHNSRLALLTASGGLVLDPKLAATQTHLFGYKIEGDANTLYATPQARFVEQAAALGAPSKAVAAHLQSLFDTGANLDDGFTALSSLATVDSYGAALKSLTGRVLGSMGAFRYQSSRNFVGNLYQGCEPDGSQKSCTWARVQAGTSKRDETADALGYHANAQAYEMGAQTALGDTLTLGGALAYEHSKFRDDGSSARIRGDSLLAGIGLRYDAGPLEIAGALDAGYGWYRSARTILVGATAAPARARPEVWNVGAHLTASYRVEVGKSYLRPFAELRGVGVHGKAYAENGLSPFNLAVSAASDFVVNGALGTEVGTTVAFSSQARLRPFASAAVEFGGANDWQTTARFAGQPQSEGFAVRTNAPRTYGRFAVGASLLGARNVDLTLSYNPEFGRDYTSQAVVARLDWRF